MPGITIQLDTSQFQRGAAQATHASDGLSHTLKIVLQDANKAGQAFSRADRSAMTLSRDFKKLRADLTGLNSSMMTMNQALLTALSRIEKLGHQSAATGKEVSALGKAMGYLKGFLAVEALRQVGTAMVDVALATDRLDKAYLAITGSAAGAQEQLNFIKDTSQQLGLEYLTTAESAKTFFSASKGTTLEKDMNQIFTSFSQAGAAMSLSSDQMQGVFLALGQMISKGKVQAEELRGQLGERLPGAFQMAARAMGMTTAELDKFMADGKLVADDLLPKLADYLTGKYAAAAEEAAKGVQGSINNMSNAWTAFKQNVTDNALIIAAINAVTHALNGASTAFNYLRALADVDKGYISLSDLNAVGADKYANESKSVEGLDKRLARMKKQLADLESKSGSRGTASDALLRGTSNDQNKKDIENLKKGIKETESYRLKLLVQGAEAWHDKRVAQSEAEAQKEAEARKNAADSVDKYLQKGAAARIRTEEDSYKKALKDIEAAGYDEATKQARIAEANKLHSENLKKINESGKKGGASAENKMLNAQEKVRELRAEIDKLLGNSYGDTLQKKLADIEKVARETGVDIGTVKEEYEAAFKSNTLDKFNRELLQAKGDTAAIAELEIADKVKEWGLRLKEAGYSAEEAEGHAKQLEKALRENAGNDQLEKKASLLKEIGELTGDTQMAEEYQVQLINKQADAYIRAMPEMEQYIEKWRELQTLATTKEGYLSFDMQLRRLSQSWEDYTKSAMDWGTNFGSLMTGTIDGITGQFATMAQGGKASFKDLANSIIGDITRMTTKLLIMYALERAMKMVSAFSIGNATDAAAQANGFSSANPMADFYGGMGFAKGGVFSGGSIHDYSNQVVNRPTVFGYGTHLAKYAKGGVMGEAGPEAIMPLTRGSDGKLGVQATGGAAAVNIIVNNNTPAEVKTEQRQNDDGSLDIEMMIVQTVNESMNRRGGQLNSSLRSNWGLSSTIVGR